MPELSSQTLPLGVDAPDFALINPLDGSTYSRDDVAGEHGLVVIFMCNHCPYVQCLIGDLVQYANDYHGTGLGICAISANDPAAYPDDAPERMAELAEQCGFPFPYLFDETQEVARSYGAVCTPDIFAFERSADGGLSLHYTGQFDNTRPSQRDPVGPPGRDLRRASERILERIPPIPADEQSPSVGCSIKWR